MSFLAPFPGNSRVTRTFLSANAVASGGTSFNFSGLSFGPVAADRYLLAFVGMQAAPAAQIGSVTLDGGSATQLLAVTGLGTGATKGKAYIIAMPTGTSGDLVINLTGSATRFSYALYALYGIGSSTPYDSGVDNSGVMDTSLDIPDSGVGIAATFDSIAHTSTWGGLTEDSDGIVGSHTYTSASLEVEAAQTVSVTCTQSTGNAPVFMAASFAQ